MTHVQARKEASTAVERMEPGQRRRWEIGIFLTIVAVVIPLLTFFAIATYALIVWIAQMLILGPPGPPMP